MFCLFFNGAYASMKMTINSFKFKKNSDGGTYSLQNSYVFYKLESKPTSNFFLTSKKLGPFEKNNFFLTNSIFLVVDDQQK